MTSTPFVRKKKAVQRVATARAKKKDDKDDDDDDNDNEEDVKLYKAKIDVHDGFAMRPVTIVSNEGLLTVLTKVAEAMSRENPEVQMCYEAPWSAKEGTKKCLSYVTNTTELKVFWSAYKIYAKKKEDVCGIVFRNRKEVEVSCSVSQ